MRRKLPAAPSFRGSGGALRQEPCRTPLRSRDGGRMGWAGNEKPRAVPLLGEGQSTPPHRAFRTGGSGVRGKTVWRQRYPDQARDFARDRIFVS